jgi:hypothetical protein
VPSTPTIHPELSRGVDLQPTIASEVGRDRHRLAARHGAGRRKACSHDTPRDQQNQDRQSCSHVTSNTPSRRKLRRSPRSDPAAAPGATRMSGATHEAATRWRAPPLHPRSVAPRRCRCDARPPPAIGRRSRTSPPPREAGAIVPAPGRPPPTVGVPAEVGRPVSEVRPGADSPDPRGGYPGPPVGRVEDVRVRLAVAARWSVGIGVAVGGPDPAVLLGVDPLAVLRGCRRRRLLLLSSGRRWRGSRRLRGLTLGRRCDRGAGWSRRAGLLLGMRRGCEPGQRGKHQSDLDAPHNGPQFRRITREMMEG